MLLCRDIVVVYVMLLSLLLIMVIILLLQLLLLLMMMMVKMIIIIIMMIVVVVMLFLLISFVMLGTKAISYNCSWFPFEDSAASFLSFCLIYVHVHCILIYLSQQQKKP